MLRVNHVPSAGTVLYKLCPQPRRFCDFSDTVIRCQRLKCTILEFSRFGLHAWSQTMFEIGHFILSLRGHWKLEHVYRRQNDNAYHDAVLKRGSKISISNDTMWSSQFDKRGRFAQYKAPESGHPYFTSSSNSSEISKMAPLNIPFTKCHPSIILFPLHRRHPAIHRHSL